MSLTFLEPNNFGGLSLRMEREFCRKEQIDSLPGDPPGSERWIVVSEGDPEMEDEVVFPAGDLRQCIKILVRKLPDGSWLPESLTITSDTDENKWPGIIDLIFPLEDIVIDVMDDLGWNSQDQGKAQRFAKLVFDEVQRQHAFQQLSRNTQAFNSLNLAGPDLNEEAGS